jgi:hypothetical protein
MPVRQYFSCQQILSIKIGTGDLAKYPFLNDASDYVRETHFDFQEFDRPEMNHIIDRAAERLEREIAKGLPDEKLDRYEIEILTFLVTLIMVKSIGMEPILKKHALFEAMRAEKFLTEDQSLYIPFLLCPSFVTSVCELSSRPAEISSSYLAHFKLAERSHNLHAPETGDVINPHDVR